MDTPFPPALALACTLLVLPCSAQVNSGSDGHDGAFNPTQNVEIDMADHPDGIYHYSSVNIPAGVTVMFRSNAKNTPVVWLSQGDCVIRGTVRLAGAPASGTIGGSGGPGGWAGGSGGNYPSSGAGPGGGAAAPNADPLRFAEGGSNGSLGTNINGSHTGKCYGNFFLIPMMGGSGGGGALYGSGGGGGGAMLIASSTSIQLYGIIVASGGAAASGASGNSMTTYGGGGSGGCVRLVATNFTGSGTIDTSGAPVNLATGPGGTGRVRIDSFQNTFGGNISGILTKGFQPIILPAPGQGVQVSIASIAGNAVAASPSGVLANPDVIIPAQQGNPLPIVVNCSNVPLNTEISVIVHPASGPDVQAVGMNNVGTLAASKGTISLNMPRGGGIIFAKCVSGVAGLGADTSSKGLRTKSLAETGWTADGERFAKMEITAELGGKQQIAYLTESGKRYAIP